MKLWTIQTEKAYEILQKQGYLVTDPKYIDSFFLKRYIFLIKKMLDILGECDNIDYPLWAWHSYGAWNKCPDLRSSGFLQKGEIGYRIEFDIEDDKVVLSDFDMWHWVLNNWYVPEDLESDDELLDYSQSEIEKSWDRVFEIEKYNSKWIQATFWKLEQNMVKNVKRFKAR